MYEISIERMCELETMAKNCDIKFPLNLKEWRYYERAEKMPYDEILECIILFEKYPIPLTYIISSKKLYERYDCSDKELYQRIEDVYRVKRYKESYNNKLLKEQKRMVKRMNNH